MESLTLSGRRFSPADLKHIKETCALFDCLSRRELAFTICEHLGWKTPRGKLKIDSCLKALEGLSERGLCEIPKLQKQNKRQNFDQTQLSEQTQRPSETIECSVEDLDGVFLRRVEAGEQNKLWKEYVERYHYLKFRRCVGSFIRYFIFIRYKDKEHVVGCIQWVSTSLSNFNLRDEWIGWRQQDREKNLQLVLNNNRFLIFPWVNVRNLASKALSLAAKQVPKDFLKTYKYRPVLLETFVDSERYSGACYSGAGWTFLGKTKGRGRLDTNHEYKESIKLFFVKQVDKNFRAILMNQRSQKAKLKNKRNNRGYEASPSDEFVYLWKRVVDLVSRVGIIYDSKWQVRRRVIDTSLLMLLILRLVFSKNKQGYRTTIDELWHNCKTMNISLPQDRPISSSSFSAARAKLDENVFRELNDLILREYNQRYSNQHKWLNHDVFAIDGSKFNLPPETMKDGYKTHLDGAHYPQGLVSCLYHLKSSIPHDFDLVSHHNERKCAIAHLKKLEPQNNLVVYDRGYFSFAMLYYHQQASVHAVFRLSSTAGKQIENFVAGDSTDEITWISLSKSQRNDTSKEYPDVKLDPIQIRLLKYKFDGTTYYLATTLLDSNLYKIADFSDLYHSRWGVEELYKIKKEFIKTEEFHAKSIRGVKQEVYASFVLVTLARLFSNQTDSALLLGCHNPQENYPFKVNFKNAIATFMRHFEVLIADNSQKFRESLKSIFQTIARSRQRIRPFRQYRRVSKMPEKKNYTKATRKLESKKPPQLVYV